MKAFLLTLAVTAAGVIVFYLGYATALITTRLKDHQ